MIHRFLAIIIGASVLILANYPAIEVAMAIDIRCVEASKYKYLFKIFDNDHEKIAKFFGVDVSQLPEPEMCRAVVVTGKIDDVGREADKLTESIAQNNGWLADLYLGSRGGSVRIGLILGDLARILWLKTNAIDSNISEYFPDFGALSIPASSSRESERIVLAPEPIGEIAAGWSAYLAATRGLSQIKLPSGEWQCASSCELIHAGGVDRHGIAYVHRFQSTTLVTPDTSDVMLKGSVAFLEHYEETGIAYLKHMDAGAEAIQRMQSTPPERASRALTSRFPREVSQLLNSQCETDVEDLERQEIRIRATLANAATTKRNETELEHIRRELARIHTQREKAEVCITAAHERKRLAQFANYCSERRCNRVWLAADVNRLFAELNRSLAEQGQAWAQRSLGIRYEKGDGAPQNFTEAAKWYRRAAEQNDAHAQNNLGRLYFYGTGLTQDYAEAAKWYRLAADHGRADAQYSLGFMYLNGRGVPQDYAEAMKWHRLAADQGRADAQYGLGFMYLNGLGVPQDDVRAHMWFSLSAVRGSKDAVATRDRIAKRMTALQIAEAEKLAREWKPKPSK